VALRRNWGNFYFLGLWIIDGAVAVLREGIQNSPGPPSYHSRQAELLINLSRSEEDQALLCVDGLHGFGVEDFTVSDLGCDFFIAGSHKWIFGPRGTGLIWGNPRAWRTVMATIPTMGSLWRHVPREELIPSAWMTPGGFHAFEHRWALTEAFRFHMQIGKAKVTARIHELNRQCREGLAKMHHVKLQTPLRRNGVFCSRRTHTNADR
jgi:isopenicillin-N epimerase